MASDPDQLVLLTSTRTEFEARALAASLEAEGIQASVFAAASMGLQWEGGISNAVKVMVRRADLEPALEALRQSRVNSRGIDWVNVDVGELEEGSTPAPEAQSERFAGYSRAMYRLRSVGLVLMFAPFMLRFVVGVDLVTTLIAIGALIVFVVLAWNPPSREGPSPPVPPWSPPSRR